VVALIVGTELLMLLSAISVAGRRETQFRDMGVLRIVMASEQFLPWAAIKGFGVQDAMLILTTDQQKHFIKIPRHEAKDIVTVVKLRLDLSSNHDFGEK
jgi:hypothetical protein